MSWSNRFQLYDPGARASPEGTGLVFDMQRFSIHDGPGIRTLVFFKGCPLRCSWCQNPESMRGDPEIMVIPGNCIACGKCVEVCPEDLLQVSADGVQLVDRERCSLPGCGLCQQYCYANAINISGRYLTVAEVMAEVERDREFYERTGGGVTFSGGEPAWQPDFLESLVGEAKARNLHTAIETCGHVPWDTLERVLRHVDLVLYDLKHMDAETHRRETGVSNDRLLENLKRIDAAGLPIRLRVPLVPGYNDSEHWNTAPNPTIHHQVGGIL